MITNYFLDFPVHSFILNYNQIYPYSKLTDTNTERKLHSSKIKSTSKIKSSSQPNDYNNNPKALLTLSVTQLNYNSYFQTVVSRFCLYVVFKSTVDPSRAVIPKALRTHFLLSFFLHELANLFIEIY